MPQTYLSLEINTVNNKRDNRRNKKDEKEKAIWKRTEQQSNWASSQHPT